ncbi:hypothetical protein MSSAC_3395 [Methanosarcina siciliae C2J]|uniref:YncE family protein n=1 Tax=Methanosarcina siciliae C2J TaxID=1434118 RepID=A0A0E3PS78_9EURY|nr:hypothetical protein MSSAC_3395 [Methanosarcina siciliae C2J]
MDSKNILTISIDTFSILHPSAAISNKAYRRYTFIRAFGITALLILILIGVAGAAPFAYVTNLGDYDQRGYYYDTNYNGTLPTHNVAVIDTATNNVTARVPVEGWPRDIAVNPAGTKVYVATPGFGPTISVIDIATNKVSATVNVGGYPMQVAVNPAGTKVYVTDRDSTNISVIDTATNTLMEQINVGMITRNVVIRPDGKKIYVTNIFNNTTSVIDAITNKVTTTISVGDSPYEVEWHLMEIRFT